MQAIIGALIGAFLGAGAMLITSKRERDRKTICRVVKAGLDPLKRRASEMKWFHACFPEQVEYVVNKFFGPDEKYDVVLLDVGRLAEHGFRVILDPSVTEMIFPKIHPQHEGVQSIPKDCIIYRKL